MRFYHCYAVYKTLTEIIRQGADLQEIHFFAFHLAILPFNLFQHENKEIDTNIRLPILLNCSITMNQD